ncbi:S9 family peptidase [Paenibacillaceae bacterium]|nr:S9 family peptidase [Paenibacillaceae bacterium]
MNQEANEVRKSNASRRKIVPEDLLRYRWVSDPAVHPKASSAAYVLKEIDKQTNDYRTHIRVVSLDGRMDKAWTEGKHDASPSWRPDGAQLAFLRVLEGKPQLFVIAGEGQEPKQLTAARHGVAVFAWSPDGKRIVYSTRTSADESAGPIVVSETESSAVPSASPLSLQRGSAYDRTIPKAEGAGWWDGLYTHLFLLEVDEGTIIQLTSGQYNAAQPTWSPDGQQIAFLAKVPRDGEDADLQPFNDLYTLDLPTMEAVQLTASAILIQHFSYSSDGTELAMIGNDRRYGSGTQNRLYTIGANGGEAKAVSVADLEIGNAILNDMKPGNTIAGPLYAVNGSGWYAIGTCKGQANLYYLVENSEPQAIIAGEQDIYHLAISSDGQQLVMAVIDLHGPGELYRFDVQTGERMQLTSWNQPLMSELAVSEPEAFWYETSDGFDLQGWIMKPFLDEQAAGESNGGIPLVLAIHGGPHAMYAPTYSHELQVMVAQGCAVMFVNPRGSIGYGQEIAKACRGDFGGGDYRDLMEAVDAVLAKFDGIDASRLGVIGGSYGGLMTNWIVSHTDRFKAAVTQRGISNWLSFYGTSDIGISYTEGIVGGNPWNDPQLLWERSPLAYADKVQIPVLIMHGEQDLRCPVAESDQWYTALKRLGQTTRLIRYPGSNHNFLKLGKPAYRMDAQQQVNAWFAEHLLGGDE